MGFSLGGIVHGIEHGAGDVERGFGNWNGPHGAGSPLEKFGRVLGAASNPEAVAGQAFHRLSNPVQTWEHMGPVQHGIVEGAGAVGALGLGIAGGGALLGGGAAEVAAGGGEAAAAGEGASAGGGMSLGARLGRGLMIHEAVHGITGGGGGSAGGYAPNPYEAQQVAHQQLGALNASQFG